MRKINVNELTVRELKELASDFFPKMTMQDINGIPLGILQAMIFDEIKFSTSSDPLGESEENFEIYSSIKHCPARKKKAKRLRKKKVRVEYKNLKKGEWATYSRRKLKDSEVTNRSFNNKATKTYTPNRRFGYIN